MTNWEYLSKILNEKDIPEAVALLSNLCVCFTVCGSCDRCQEKIKEWGAQEDEKK